MSHTPGPWKWWTSNSWRRLTAHDVHGRHERDGGVLCPIVASDGHPDVVVSEDDMNLIAAAPDLLEAARHAYKELMWAYDQIELESGAAGLRIAAQELWAAISKAKGEQS